MNVVDNFHGTITKQVVNSKKLNFGKIIRTLTISDLHSYTTDVRKAARLAEVIKSQNPDIIFIAGDLYSGGTPWEGGEKLNRFKAFIQNISEACPVCITWGNHDIRDINDINKETRISNLRRLEEVRPGSIYPLYNENVFINGMEIVGYVPRFELMEDEGLKIQLHGIAHDEFIKDYERDGVKFQNKPGYLNVYLGHDPHLIAASENGIGLEDLSVCDFFITGHLHNGYKPLFEPIEKMKKLFTGSGFKGFELDMGYTEQQTGIVDKDNNMIPGSKKLWIGPTNLCRGIVYIDNDAQQKFLQMPDGKFYINMTTEINKQVWKPTIEETARKEILDNNLHFMLISEGIAPSFLPREKLATMNVVDIGSEEMNNLNIK